MLKNGKQAFTLAEVLITLGIIGIVASMTIPTLIQNYNEKSWSTGKDVFQKKLTVALKTMVTQQDMYGYETTADFINNGLSKHFKIIKTCSLDEMSNCFPENFTYGTEDLELSDITEADNMGQEEWVTTPMGVVFANGVSALMLYDNNCSYIDPYDNMADATACVSVAYDVNGLKTPNTLGKDLGTMNATLSKFACIAPGFKKSTGICITKVMMSESGKFPMEDCLAQKEKLGLQYCWDGYSSGYYGDGFAGAVAQCGSFNNVATYENLMALADYIYDENGLNRSRWDEVFAFEPPSGGVYSFLYRKESQTTGYAVSFGNTYGGTTRSDTRGWLRRTICVR